MTTTGDLRIKQSLVAGTTSAAYADMRETHSALVFLIGDGAYKLKKPVDMGFLDFSTRESASPCAAAR